MIKIRTIDVFGFEGALYGMRMPFESHDKSDSKKCAFVSCNDCIYGKCPFDSVPHVYTNIGKNDMKLCKKLIKGGSEHRKFLRMIHVQAEVNAPRYWWTEADTYKFIEKNSSSTMHLITKRKLTKEDFTIEKHMNDELVDVTIDALNNLIDMFNTETNKVLKDSCFRTIKQLLPESFMQRRVIDTNYEELLNIYRQRKNHKLSEWHEFCAWIKSLPYMEEFIEDTDMEKKR